jgi:hypothetical protein
MMRFADEGVPVIHMVNVNELATHYGLPLFPLDIPPVGDGKIFYKEERSSRLAAAVLALIVLFLIVFVRLDWGYRFFSVNRRESTPNKPQQMV